MFMRQGPSVVRPARRYQLGDWTITPDLDLVCRADVERRLPPKAMDVLVYLLDQAGQVVSPAALMECVRAGRCVEESSIYQRIAQVRRVLGDDRTRPTLPWLRRTHASFAQLLCGGTSALGSRTVCCGATAPNSERNLPAPSTGHPASPREP